MLGNAGYGLIAGRWSDVDAIVTQSFVDAAGDSYQDRLKQIETIGGPENAGKPKELVSPMVDPSDPSGGHSYSEAAVVLAHAGVVVPGCEYSKPAMDALRRKGNPCFPSRGWGRTLFKFLSKCSNVGITSRSETC